MSHAPRVASAHERIGDLEAALAGRFPRPRPVLRWRWGRAVLATTLGIACGAVLARSLLPRQRVVVGEEPAKAAFPAGPLELADGAPVVVDADHVFVRAWRPRSGEAPLHVVAIDRKTLAVAWRSSPFPGLPAHRGELARLDDGIGLVDGAKLGHVLDPRSGVETRSFAVSLDAACPFATGLPCVPLEQDFRAQKLFRDSSVRVVRDGTDRVTVVARRAGVGPGVNEHGLVWRDDGRVAWQGPLVPRTRTWTPYPNTAPPGLTALAHGRILHVYPMPDGEHRIAVRALATGALAADVPLPGLGYGSSVVSLFADGDDAYLLANRSLYVLDAATGAIRRRLDVF